MTLFTDLQNAGLPVFSTNGETQATFTRTLTPQEEDIYENLLDPGRQARLIEQTTSMTQIRSEYQNMITRLEQIQAANNPTNAQIIQAVKDEALYIERLMKVLAKLI